MRGVISEKLNDFIKQARVAAAQAKADGVQYTPELVRGNLENLAAFIGKGPDLAHVEESVLVTPTHEIGVRIYSPDPKQSLPVVLHYHGGGHMCGNIALYDTISRKISKSAHCIVIAVEYRLAPEFPYPAGVDDCYFALQHYKELLASINHSDKLIILGDSAGGAICTTLSSRNLADSSITIDKQILLYPSVDYTMENASMSENGSGFLLEKARIAWYFDNYFQDISFLDNGDIESKKRVSPLYMPMTDAMPKTLVFTAGCDPLRDEGIAYVEALKSLDVTVEHHVFDGMIHAYMLLDSLVATECEQTYQIIGDFIQT
jgi:acetyl esterase/lipase